MSDPRIPDSSDTGGTDDSGDPDSSGADAPAAAADSTCAADAAPDHGADPVPWTRPGLAGDRSFFGMTMTQLLGVLNDNAFKQGILLLAVNQALARGEQGSLQAVAMGLFSLPFLLFSGLAGNLSDRVGKDRVILWMKIAEFLLMLLGALAFWMGNLPLLMGALFLMGTQSAFFGPAKYGILPEMIPKRLLSRANGIIQLTTFLAIILGTAAAGELARRFPDALYIPGLVYAALALVGIATACMIRRLPAARPDLEVIRRPFGDLFPTLLKIYRDGSQRMVILAYAYFWFVGGVIMPTLNVYGRRLMDLDEAHTSFLLVSLSTGMALGFAIGGYLSKASINLHLTNIGIAGLFILLVAMTFVHSPGQVGVLHVMLVALGICGGLFALPLQTYIQHHAPRSEKGRVIAAMNFVNWIFIFSSAAFQGVAERTLAPNHIPAVLAGLTLLLGVFLLPRLHRIALEDHSLAEEVSEVFD